MNLEAAEKAIRDFLIAMGQDLEREGLKGTPKRYVNLFKEFITTEQSNLTKFESEHYDQIVISSNIQFCSLCEHNLLPFFGEAAIAYIPGDEGQTVGVSKLTTTLEKHARSLQTQERITKDVANELMIKINAKGVGVVIKARHLCHGIYGVKNSNCITTTCMLGVFSQDLNTRQEFLKLIL